MMNAKRSVSDRTTIGFAKWLGLLTIGVIVAVAMLLLLPTATTFAQEPVNPDAPAEQSIHEEHSAIDSADSPDAVAACGSARNDTFTLPASGSLSGSVGGNDSRGSCAASFFGKWIFVGYQRRSGPQYGSFSFSTSNGSFTYTPNSYQTNRQPFDRFKYRLRYRLQRCYFGCSWTNSYTYSNEATVTINAPVSQNQPPTANAGGPYSGNEASPISLNGSASTDDKAVVSYEWDCTNDGSYDVTSASPTGSTCTYPDNGTFTVKLHVSDAEGETSTATASVTVNNVAPTATFGNNGPVNEGSSISLSLTSPVDPGADTFTYAFDCGDGSGYGAFSATSTATCATNDNGTRAVKGKIKDDDDGENEYSASVTVNNVAPTATFGNDGPVSEDTTAIVTFTDQADASSVDTTAGFSYAYDFDNDGTFELNTSSASATVPASYLPDPGFVTVAGRITDKDGGYTDLTTDIEVLLDTDGDGIADINDPDDDNDGTPDTEDDFPLTAPNIFINLGGDDLARAASNGTIHGVAGESLTIPIGFLAYGANVHSFDVILGYETACLRLDDVTLVQINDFRSLDHQPLAEDPQGTSRTQIILTDVGSADPLQDGRIFDLEFTVLCGRGTSDISLVFTSFGSSGGLSIAGTAAGATLELNSRPDAVDDDADTDEDNPVVIFVEGNDADADDGDGIDVISLTQPEFGSAWIVDGDDNGNQVDDTIVFDPQDAFHWLAQGQSATVSFQYTQRDVPPDNATVTVTDEDTATVMVTIAGVNDAPEAADDTATTDEDSVVTVYVLANDTDPDTSDSGHIVSAVTQPTWSDGPLTHSAGSVLINGSGGSVTYDPRRAMDWLALDQTQDVTFEYTVSDGKGGTDSASVTVTVVGVNDAPAAVDDTATQAPYLVIGPNDGSLNIDVLANDSDPDNDSLSIQIVDGGGSDLQVVDDNGYQSVVYTPDGTQGLRRFQYEIHDGHQRFDTAWVTIAVGIRGDCNKDGVVDAGDLSACVREILDDDGDFWLDTENVAPFDGSPVGCDANRDEAVNAGDLACKVNMLMGVNTECVAQERSASKASLALSSGADRMALRFSGNGNGVSAAVVTLAVQDGASFDGLTWSLPEGFESASFFADGRLTLVVYSLGLAALPDGAFASLGFSGAGDGIAISADASSLGGVDGSSVDFVLTDAPEGTDGPKLNLRLFLPFTQAAGSSSTSAAGDMSQPAVSELNPSLFLPTVNR